MIEHILLDLDDVLVDWKGAVAKLMGKPEEVVANMTWSSAEALGVTNKEMWEAIDDLGASFWANLEPLPWAHDLVELVSKWDWSVATAYAKDPSCSYGKHMWLARNFGRDFEGMMIGKRKWLMAGPGRVLIDDREKNIDDFIAHGGIGILLPQPWNNNRNLCSVRMEYVRLRLEEVDDEI